MFCMARLVSSDLALRTLLLLSQRDEGIRVSEVADALDISYTGAEKALDILVADRLASVDERRYSFSSSPKAVQALGFALAFLPPEDAVTALVRGNHGVEFAGADQDGVLVVFRRFVKGASVRRLQEALDRLREVAPGTEVDYTTKEELRRVLLEDLTPRERAQAMRVLAGNVDRTFPDRTKHGDFDARPLGHVNAALALPSARRLREFASEHGLRRILAFGSATRDDFRPDSDLDLLVEPTAGHRIGLSQKLEIMADADRLFGRDVDIVTTPIRRTSLAARIDRDGVVLYDAAR